MKPARTDVGREWKTNKLYTMSSDDVTSIVINIMREINDTRSCHCQMQSEQILFDIKSTIVLYGITNCNYYISKWKCRCFFYFSKAWHLLLRHTII